MFKFDPLKARIGMGRILLEILEESKDVYYNQINKVSEKSEYLAKLGFQVAKPTEEAERVVGVPTRFGKVVRMGKAAYGKAFVHNYGEDAIIELKVGDVVCFTPMQTYKLDNEGKYHLISDDHVHCVWDTQDFEIVENPIENKETAIQSEVK
jgi:hypothetical protein